MTDWHPIETAPQDGSMFLAYYKGGHGPRVGSMQWATWEKDHKKRYFQSWTTLTESKRATHWMPLPEPPKEPSHD